MSTTLITLIDRIRRRASELENENVWPEALVIDGINEGLKAIADDYRGRYRIKTYTSEENDRAEFRLPDDYVRLSRITPRRAGADDSTSYSSDVYLGETWWKVGDTHYDADEAGAPAGYYILDDMMYVPDGLDDGDSIVVIYEARWPDANDPSDIISVPSWVERAVAYYAIAYCLQEPGVKYAQVGFYKDRFDSGRPLDNPALTSSDWFYGKYQEVCERHMKKGE